MKRSGVLSLLLVLGLVATSLPLSEPLAYWTNHAEASRSRKKSVRRKRSRAWWRRRRAWLRRQRARREARRRQESGQLLRRSHGSALVPKPVSPAHIIAAPKPQPLLPVPSSWSMAGAGAQGEMKFNVMANNRIAGTTAWARVTGVQPSALSVISPRTKLLGGVSTSSLRRTVIDRMIVEGGWVINDVERQLGGRHVFIVFAQSNDANGARLTRAFYFTELDGQLYSLATTAPVEFAAQLAAQSEQFVAALNERHGNSAQAAQTK